MDYITANVKTFNLELYLISYVHDYETALRILHPIIKFAKFKRCAIRLSPNRDLALEQLAEATASRAIGGQQSEESSNPRLRFLDLPLGIRDQVLQYTDIVTPMKEVMWNPKDGYSVCYCTSLWDERSVAFFGKNSGINHAFKFRDCWKTSRFGCFCSPFPCCLVFVLDVQLLVLTTITIPRVPHYLGCYSNGLLFEEPFHHHLI